MSKKTKRKLNKKRVLNLLLFLVVIVIFITYLWNIKVSNVLILGNNEIEDSTIIKQTGLRNYPYFRDINKRNLEKEIINIPLIANAKVTKCLNGTLKIEVEEETPLMYLENTTKIITSQNNVYENIQVKKITMPTLKSSLNNDTQELLVKALNKLDNNIFNMIS